MEEEHPNKYNCDDYNYECANCDDVFYDEDEASKHEKMHKEAFKKVGKDVPTGIWRVGLRL